MKLGVNVEYLVTEIITYQKPISINHMYGQTGKRRYLCKAGKEYKETLLVHAMSVWDGGTPIDFPIHVDIDYYFPNKLRRDVTNYDKPILDTLSGVIYQDDCQIRTILLTKQIDRVNPRTVIRIYKSEESDV